MIPGMLISKYVADHQSKLVASANFHTPNCMSITQCEQHLAF
uniref:Uncharacterized protein n=1 Tax=Arundo donax TaxID=35708 RepID=A0A0A9AS17_ARUDO